MHHSSLSVYATMYIYVKPPLICIQIQKFNPTHLVCRTELYIYVYSKPKHCTCMDHIVLIYMRIIDMYKELCNSYCMRDRDRGGEREKVIRVKQEKKESVGGWTKQLSSTRRRTISSYPETSEIHRYMFVKNEKKKKISL